MCETLFLLSFCFQQTSLLKRAATQREKRDRNPFGDPASRAHPVRRCSCSSLSLSPRFLCRRVDGRNPDAAVTPVGAVNREHKARKERRGEAREQSEQEGKGNQRERERDKRETVRCLAVFIEGEEPRGTHRRCLSVCLVSLHKKLTKMRSYSHTHIQMRERVCVSHAHAKTVST